MTVEASVHHHDPDADLLLEKESEIDTQSMTKKPTKQCMLLSAQERQRLTRRLNVLEKNEKSLLDLVEKCHHVLGTADEKPGQQTETLVAAAAAVTTVIEIEIEIEVDKEDIRAALIEAGVEAGAAVVAVASDPEEMIEESRILVRSK